MSMFSWSSFRQVMRIQNISSIGLFYEDWEVCGRVSDSEELVGSNHR